MQFACLFILLHIQCWGDSNESVKQTIQWIVCSDDRSILKSTMAETRACGSKCKNESPHLHQKNKTDKSVRFFFCHRRVARLWRVRQYRIQTPAGWRSFSQTSLFHLLFRRSTPYESPHLHHLRRLGLIQSCRTFFSLHKGFISLSVNEYQSLVGVFNHTFAGLFFFIYNNYGTKASSTERFWSLKSWKDLNFAL